MNRGAMVRRVARLERLQRSGPCPACGAGSHPVRFLWCDDEDEDADDPNDVTPCAACGRVPLTIIFRMVDPASDADV